MLNNSSVNQTIQSYLAHACHLDVSNAQTGRHIDIHQMIIVVSIDSKPFKSKEAHIKRSKSTFITVLHRVTDNYLMNHKLL